MMLNSFIELKNINKIFSQNYCYNQGLREGDYPPDMLALTIKTLLKEAELIPMKL